MTVTYTAEVATTSLACFLKLLLRWRGSIYKLLWKEVSMFLLTYYILSFVYRFGLGENQKRIFEMLSRYCEVYNNLIPVAFVLGFYVTLVVSRWWEQFNKIPWPDRMALFVMANVHGHDERGRLMRRTIMRYLCLAHVITLSSISTAVKKRFPTFQHMTEAGFMNPNEEKIIDEMKTQHNKYFVPLVWTTSLVTRARKEGRIKDDFAVKTLIDEVNEFRGKLGTLFNYDWITVPLVYTQVATIAVYMFVLSCLMGRQFTHQPNTMNTDIYVPVFTFLQISFYIGWLKVAEVLVNPFGEDDDDFEMNTVIDRNLQVSYLIVDEMHQEHPELIKDQYWDETDFEVPYTAASEQFRVTTPHLGSAMDISLEPRETEFIPVLSSITENMVQDGKEVYVNVGNTSPTDIPHSSSRRKLTRNISKSSSSGSQKHNPLWNFLRRSVSRDSRITNATDSPRIAKSKKYRRFESITTQATTPPQSSPTNNSQMISESSFNSQDDIFNMDDLSDVWGDEYSDRRLAMSSGGEGRESDLYSSDSRLLHKKKYDKTSGDSETNKPLVPGYKLPESISKQTFKSSKSSLPSIDEAGIETNEKERLESSGSNDSEVYDTVKRVIPGVPLSATSSDKMKAIVEKELSPPRVIIFERSRSKPNTSPESQTGSKSSNDPVRVSRTASIPKVSQLRKQKSAVDQKEHIELDVRRSISLHENIENT